MKVKNLLMVLLTLLLSSCLNEPALYVCTIVDNNILYCHYTRNEKDMPDKEINIIDAIGFQCVTSGGYAMIKAHHEDLHRRLGK